MSEYTCCFCFSSPCLCVRPGRNADDMGMPPPPRVDAMSDDNIAEFKPGYIINEPLNMIEVHFEDVAHMSVPLIDGVYHWIDKLVAFDDGRVVGLNFWIYKPIPKSGEPRVVDLMRLSASEIACQRWPGDSAEHRAMRAAFCDGATLGEPLQGKEK